MYIQHFGYAFPPLISLSFLSGLFFLTSLSSILMTLASCCVVQRITCEVCVTNGRRIFSKRRNSCNKRPQSREICFSSILSTLHRRQTMPFIQTSPPLSVSRNGEGGNGKEVTANPLDAYIKLCPVSLWKIKLKEMWSVIITRIFLCEY